MKFIPYLNPLFVYTHVYIIWWRELYSSTKQLLNRKIHIFDNRCRFSIELKFSESSIELFNLRKEKKKKINWNIPTIT